MIMLDLFAGHGGSSTAMIDRGWTVHRVELTPGLLVRPIGVEPTRVVDHLVDVRAFTWSGPPPDLVWASPPCTEFTRSALPWHPGAAPPDMRLLFAALGLIATVRPVWWAIENVKGAIPWFTPHLGPPAICAAPIFLWGKLPPVSVPRIPRKERISGLRPGWRSHVPWAVSEAVAAAIERASGGRAA